MEEIFLLILKVKYSSFKSIFNTILVHMYCILSFLLDILDNPLYISDSLRFNNKNVFSKTDTNF